MELKAGQLGFYYSDNIFTINIIDEIFGSNISNRHIFKYNSINKKVIFLKDGSCNNYNDPHEFIKKFKKSRYYYFLKMAYNNYRLKI